MNSSTQLRQSGQLVAEVRVTRAKRFRWRVNAEDEVIVIDTGTFPLNSLSMTVGPTDTGLVLRVSLLNFNTE